MIALEDHSAFLVFKLALRSYSVLPASLAFACFFFTSPNFTTYKMGKQQQIDFPSMEMDIHIMMYMLTGTKLLMGMYFIMLTGLPWRRFRGFKTVLSKMDGTAASDMKKKLKTIFAGVWRLNK